MNENDYIGRLKGALGSAEFDAVANELENDKTVSREEIVKISSQFYQHMPKSTSRASSMRNIRARQIKLMAWKDEMKAGVLK